MELSGKIIQILPEKSGESARGPWRKQEYIIITEEEYPKKICFMAWSDKIDEFGIQEGEKLIVSIDLESREYNGRWYTDVKAWKITRPDPSLENTSSYTRESQNDIQSEKDSILDDRIPF